MTQKRVTSRDVAQRAGVSRTTVSFVLNDVTSMKISEQTRQRVLQAAQELGYIPDASARTLASGKTCTLGLIVSHAKLIPVDVFIPQLLHSLYDVCREHGYRLLLETAEHADQPGAFERLVRAKQIDGLIVLSPRQDDAHLRNLIETGYPLVLIGKYPHSAAHAVMPETNPEATYHTTAHLIGLGHRRIAFIHFMPIYDPATDSRLFGYRQALDEAGIPFDEHLVRDGDYSAASGYAAMTSLLAASPRPTALVAGNDTIAIGAMAAITEAGLHVPDDVAVTGHDDIPTARYTVPSLTTVRMPAQAMGRRCGEMAIQLMAGKQPTERQVVFPTELVIRHSCGANPLTEPVDD
ncbi:MAG: LacI family DNA-binding transcriptional regulator [Thermomicrobiales bacterium]